jgi:hypothetical protein
MAPACVRRSGGSFSAEDAKMLTPLSILSLDQGQTWQAPADDPVETKPPEVAPGRVEMLLLTVLGRLAEIRRRPRPSRSRA